MMPTPSLFLDIFLEMKGFTVIKKRNPLENNNGGALFQEWEAHNTFCSLIMDFMFLKLLHNLDME
jgi:hypothetical protein